MSAELSVRTGARSLTFTRTFAAPRTLVFEAFSKPELLVQWWGPRGFPVVECSLDFREGGVWRYCLRSAGGQEHWARAVYQEIVSPARIVYLENSSDAEGRVSDLLPASLVTVTLTQEAGATVLQSRVRYASTIDRDTMIAGGIARGFGQALEFLDDLLFRLKADSIDTPSGMERK